MLKMPLCEASFKLVVKAKSPILISAGKPKQLPGQEGQHTVWLESQGKKYIPASSFKGVMRSHAEHILRSYSSDFACNPLAQEPMQSQGMQLSCSKFIEEVKAQSDTPPSRVYEQICPACRLFGCTGFAGRVLLDDIYPQTTKQPLREAHIAVDRFTQGVSLGPFGRQPLDDLEFDVPITIVNFELWQLGLLALVVRDMNERLVTIGSGARHGHGEVQAKFRHVVLHYPKLRLEKKKSTLDWELTGIGNLLSDQQARAYGYIDEPSYTVEPALQGEERRGWIPFTLTGPDCRSFLRHCVRECLAPRLRGEVRFTVPRRREGNA